MTLALIIDGEFAADVATNSGWSDFCDWTDALDLAIYPELIHLVDFGWVDNLPMLQKQIEDGIREIRPGASAMEVATGLLKELRKAKKAEYIIISDGTSDAADDGSDDDEDEES